jgi:hypothetical protein
MGQLCWLSYHQGDGRFCNKAKHGDNHLRSGLRIFQRRRVYHKFEPQCFQIDSKMHLKRGFPEYVVKRHEPILIACSLR